MLCLLTFQLSVTEPRTFLPRARVSASLDHRRAHPTSAGLQSHRAFSCCGCVLAVFWGTEIVTVRSTQSPGRSYLTSHVLERYRPCRQHLWSPCPRPPAMLVGPRSLRRCPLTGLRGGFYSISNTPRAPPRLGMSFIIRTCALNKTTYERLANLS